MKIVCLLLSLISCRSYGHFVLIYHYQEKFILGYLDHIHLFIYNYILIIYYFFYYLYYNYFSGLTVPLTLIFGFNST